MTVIACWQLEPRRGRNVARDGGLRVSDLELPFVVRPSDTGCIPLFLIVAAASGEAKNRRNCFAISGSFELTATPPENTVIF